MPGLFDYVSSAAQTAKNNASDFLNDPKYAMSKIISALTDQAAASQAATKSAWATHNPDLMAQNALDSSRTALGFAPLGITAYHGSPHLFDKFELLILQ